MLLILNALDMSQQQQSKKPNAAKGPQAKAQDKKKAPQAASKKK